jgi:CRISPR-associated protein (TIGR03984 family)
MKREIKKRRSTMTFPGVKTDFADEKEYAWLLKQAKDHKLEFLLAHADDGVIWGRIDGEKLHLSTGIAANSPKLRGVTLQSCRLFGNNAELYIWRNGDGWRSRLIEDGDEDDNGAPALDESHLLWGTTRLGVTNGFTLLTDGQMGHQHAPPIEIDAVLFDGNRRPARLLVRHYLVVDDKTHLSRIGYSRLVKVDSQ